jgi:hypothetical protein
MVWVGLGCKQLIIAFGLGLVWGGFETISRPRHHIWLRGM